MTTITISSGMSSSVDVGSGSTLVVEGGGTSDDSSISGMEIVSAGGASLGDVIHIHGMADVFGSASGTIVEGGQTLESGAVGSAVHVHGAGGLTVDSGAVAYAPVVTGFMTVSAGGELQGGIIERNNRLDGENLQVFGSASGTIIRSRGSAAIEGGGVGNDLVDDGGSISVGGSGNNINIRAGVLVVWGSVDNLRFGGSEASGSDQVDVYGGGVVTSAFISSGGEGLEVLGGALSGAVASNGAYLLISGGGAASNLIVDSTVVNVSGGSVDNAYVRSGGNLALEKVGDTGTGFRVSSGGSASVFPGASVTGGYVLNGGTEVVGGVVDGATVSNGGMLAIVYSTTVAENLVLHPGADVLVSWTSATAEISGGALDVMTGGTELLSMTLSGGGSGLGVTTTVLSSGWASGWMEITVTRSGPDAVRVAPALLAQHAAAFGDGGALPGSSTVHGGGTSSAVAEMLKPR